MAIVNESRLFGHINDTGNVHDVAANEILSTGLASATAELAATATIAQNLGRAMGRINQRPIRPQAAAGVGQWARLNRAFGMGHNLTVPTGGTWAFFVYGFHSPSNAGDTRHLQMNDIRSNAGIIAGGGSVITNDFAWGRIDGFAWRIT